MCGTTKAAIIEDDDNLPRLLACSIYCTKPVHLLINVNEKITQIKKRVYLRLNTIDDYKFGVVGVDVELRPDCFNNFHGIDTSDYLKYAKT